jgi:hypothetical protein
LVSRVRICANKVVAGVRVSALQFRIRSQDTRQFASAQEFSQLEGLAVAGLSPPFSAHHVAVRGHLLFRPSYRDNRGAKLRALSRNEINVAHVPRSRASARAVLRKKRNPFQGELTDGSRPHQRASGG